MKSKVNELGVFCTGLGAVLISFTLYVQHMLADPGVVPSPVEWMLLVGPGAIIALSGIVTLIARSQPMIKCSAGIVLVMFLIDALLSLNPIKWVITALCMFAVVKTSREALAELSPQSQA